MTSHVRVVLVAALALQAATCGQKGPLTLPGAHVVFFGAAAVSPINHPHGRLSASAANIVVGAAILGQRATS